MAGADRRTQIRQVAARLFAVSGFHGVTIEDIGASCGISGPAVYRHFASKHALLSDLLVGISEHLLAGAQRQSMASEDPAEVLRCLVMFHLDFSLGNADLIRVQDRDLANLGDTGRRVRRLQRAYVEVWTGTLARAVPRLAPDQARARAHAVFGLLNSTPHSAAGQEPEAMRELLSRMALAALTA
ncbi:MAG: TetR/AcrR family transcriptional regulator [Actinomycetota bacterium]|nr:TetR/AcrR family transcriptional regulator [Actinomycetota bacterium]